MMDPQRYESDRIEFDIFVCAREVYLADDRCKVIVRNEQRDIVHVSWCFNLIDNAPFCSNMFRLTPIMCNTTKNTHW